MQSYSVESSRCKESKTRKRDPLNVRRRGRIYSRGGKLWVDFRYRGQRVREPSGLEDTQRNRATLRRQLDLIMAEIGNGLFQFAERFPHSNRKEYFSRLEARNVRKNPQDIIFGDYLESWWKAMEPGFSEGKVRDYAGVIQNHLRPFFGHLPFSEFKPVVMKKFVAQLKGRQNRYGQPLSAKSIRNYLIPLHVIVRDAMDEYGWDDLRNPFWGVKLPKVRRIRVEPFNYEEWLLLLEQMPLWYRPYFEFAVQTGLRPSEQVALKWKAIDEAFIHIELSRVRNHEKADLKTQESIRRIELRPNMRATLDRQRGLTDAFQTPYVFVNSEGRPIQQENLGKIWRRALSKSGVRYRRLYETRHTFASWALAAGESPEWVARTLGHVDTTMIYRTYGCYIPHLTRKDGSAFERQYAEATQKDSPNRHNCGHNLPNLGCQCNVTT